MKYRHRVTRGRAAACAALSHHCAAAARLNAAMRQSVDERRRPTGPTWAWDMGQERGLRGGGQEVWGRAGKGNRV